MEQTITIDKNGSLTLPKEYLKILGIFTGGKSLFPHRQKM